MSFPGPVLRIPEDIVTELVDIRAKLEQVIAQLQDFEKRLARVERTCGWGPES